MFAKVKKFVWPLCVSFAEVGIIIASAKKFGAMPTFCLFAGTALIGLSIQWAFWKQFKPLLDESIRLQKIMRAKTERSENWKTLPEYERFYALAVENYRYWIVVGLLLIPGFLCHILAFLFIVPATRPIAWLLLYGGQRYDYVAIDANTKRLPRLRRRL